MKREKIDIYKGHIVFTKTKDHFTILENGYVIVKDGKVVDTYTSIPEAYQYVPVTDYGDKFIMPSFNDMHIHAPQFRNRGLCLDINLMDWLFSCTFPEEAKFSNLDYARNVYNILLKGLWKVGNMRSLVYNTIHKDATKLLLNMFLECGLGAYVGKVNMDINAPDYLNEDTEQSLLDTEEILMQYQGISDLVHPIIAPRFVPSCSPKLLCGLGYLAYQYQAPVMSHLSEDIVEMKLVKSMYPQFPNYGSIYNYYGLFGQTPTVMAHCIFSSDEEIELMRKNGVYANHNPTSNCNLGSGMMAVKKFINRGVPVGIGCDVSGGGDISLITVMSYALSVSKMVSLYSNKQLEPLKLSEAFYITTKGGGSFFGKIGSFEPGYEFDALVIEDNYIKFFEYNLYERIQQFIFLGSSENIRERFISGNNIKEPMFLL